MDNPIALEYCKNQIGSSEKYIILEIISEELLIVEQ